MPISREKYIKLTDEEKLKTIGFRNFTKTTALEGTPLATRLLIYFKIYNAFVDDRNITLTPNLKSPVFYITIPFILTIVVLLLIIGAIANLVKFLYSEIYDLFYSDMPFVKHTLFTSKSDYMKRYGIEPVMLEDLPKE